LTQRGARSDFDRFRLHLPRRFGYRAFLDPMIEGVAHQGTPSTNGRRRATAATIDALLAGV
jgi:hypothetical protein